MKSIGFIALLLIASSLGTSRSFAAVAESFVPEFPEFAILDMIPADPLRDPFNINPERVTVDYVPPEVDPEGRPALSIKLDGAEYISLTAAAPWLGIRIKRTLAIHQEMLRLLESARSVNRKVALNLSNTLGDRSIAERGSVMNISEEQINDYGKMIEAIKVLRSKRRR